MVTHLQMTLWYQIITQKIIHSFEVDTLRFARFLEVIIFIDVHDLWK